MTLFLTTGGSAIAVNTIPDVGFSATTGTLPVAGVTTVLKIPSTNPGYVGIIYLHGAGSSSTVELGTGPTKAITDWLATHGFVVMGINTGTTWGNDAARAMISEAKAKLVADYGCDSYGKVVLYGTSHGGSNAFSWAADSHVADIACMVGVAPVSDLQDVYDGNAGAFQTSIDNAYGGHAGYLAAKPTHDPKSVADAGLLNGLQYRCWYGASDTIVTPATVTHLAGIISPAGVATSIGAYTHFDVPGQVDKGAVLHFIASNYAPTAGLRKPLTI